VKESPFDDLPRLILADWLADRDDPRGELIRVQCELRKTPSGHPARKKLAARERKLLEEHGATWTAGEHEGVKVRFQRGLLHLTIDPKHLNSGSIPKMLRPTLEQGWVETIRFSGGNVVDSRLARYRPLQHVSHLDLSDSFVSDGQFEQIAESKHLQQLVIFDLGYRHFSFESLVRVANSKLLPRLQYVPRDCDSRLGYLRGLFGRPPGMAALDLSSDGEEIAGPRTDFFNHLPAKFPELLNLSGPDLSMERLEALVHHPGARNLRALILSKCDLEDSGVSVLLQSRNLRNLEIFDLGHNSLTDAAAVEFAERGNFPNLVYLQLEYNSIADRGMIALAEAPFLEELRLLDLGPNRVGDRGMIALANSPYLKHLELISIWGNEVGDEGIVALAGSENGSHLRELYAGNNCVSDVGARAIIESPYFNNLRLLRFENNGGINHNSISGGMRKKLKERFCDGVEVGGPMG
jgi:uncharacterized protein (TIGR02996 family)